MRETHHLCLFNSLLVFVWSHVSVDDVLLICDYCLFFFFFLFVLFLFSFLHNQGDDFIFVMHAHLFATYVKLLSLNQGMIIIKCQALVVSQYGIRLKLPNSHE